MITNFRTLDQYNCIGSIIYFQESSHKADSSSLRDSSVYWDYRDHLAGMTNLPLPFLATHTFVSMAFLSSACQYFQQNRMVISETLASPFSLVLSQTEWTEKGEEQKLQDTFTNKNVFSLVSVWVATSQE